MKKKQKNNNLKKYIHGIKKRYFKYCHGKKCLSNIFKIFVNKKDIVPPRLFEKNNKHRTNYLTCECCFSKLNELDLKQKQHIYPRWVYKLLPNNGKPTYGIINAKDLTNSNQSIAITDYHSNFWCKECEDKSGKIDGKFKDLLFGKNARLNEISRPFNHKNKINAKKYPLSVNESKVAYSWTCSIILRILLAEMPIMQHTIQELYAGMINPDFKNNITICYDQERDLNSISSLTIVLEDECSHFSFEIYGLYFLMIIPREHKDVRLESKSKKWFDRLNYKSEIKVDNNISQNALTELVQDLQKYEIVGSIGCILIDRRKINKR